MAKVIYSFKIYLFRDQFHLTRHLTEFCLFASHVYVKSWITCPVTCDAPINDLHMLKISNVIQLWVNSYRCSHDKVWKQPFVCWTRTGATFFVYQQFVNAHEMQHTTVCVKHMIQKYSAMSEVWKQTSHVIYPQHSWVTLLTVHPYLPSVLLALTLTSSCHEIHSPHTWSTSAVAQSIVCSLTVISDAAERSIALMSQFNQSITKNEVEMQTLLQVVADHRRRLPDTRKLTLKATSVQSYWNLTS